MAVLTERRADGSSYVSVTGTGMTLRPFLSTDMSVNHGGLAVQGGPQPTTMANFLKLWNLILLPLPRASEAEL